MKHTILSIILIFTLAGCASTAGSHRQQPNGEQSSEQVPDTLTSSWKQYFEDPILQQLITEALDSNTQVATARLSLDQAAARLKMARLNYIPAISLEPSVSYSTVDKGSYELPLKMQWELSLGGAQRAQRKASKYEWMQSRERLLYTQIQMIASVANNYCTLVLVDEQLRLTREHVELQQSTLEALKALKDVGQATDLAVAQTEAAYYQTLASLSELELQQVQVEQVLNLLLRRPSGRVERSSLKDMTPIARDWAGVISLDSISMRPDVLEAEYALLESGCMVSAAKTQFFPTIQLSASGGWANQWGQVVDPSKMLMNLLGGISQPILNRGRIKGEYEIAKSQREQAQLAYVQTVLEAGGEVVEALAQIQSCANREQARLRQVEACEKAYENSRLLMQYSSTNYLEILTAQAAYLEAQLMSAADWLLSHQAAINLYKAVCPR